MNKKITTIGAGLLALGSAPFVATEVQIATLDQELRLKADVADIVAAEEQDHMHCEIDTGCKKVGRMKKYAYVATTTVPALEAGKKEEILALRTENSVTFNDGSVRIYAGQPFREVNGAWHSVEFATTTIDAFDLQATPVLERVFGLATQKVYADSIAPYSGAGDGYVEEQTCASFATVRAASGDLADYTTATILHRNQRSGGCYNLWSRSIFQFDTSTIGSGATISSASVSIHSDAANTIVNFSCDTTAENINLYGVNTDSDTTLAVADYPIGDWTLTQLADTDKTHAGWDTDAYQTFTLNSTGLSTINKTGYTSVGLLTNADADNSDPTCTDYGYRIYGIDMSESSGTSEDPYIEVTFSAPSPVSATSTTPFRVNGGTVRIQGGTLRNTQM